MLFAPWQAYKIAKQLKADVYHFHDPELMLVARFLKKKNNVVVYDVHEDFVTSLIKKDYLNKFMKLFIKKSFRSVEKVITKPFKKSVGREILSRDLPNRRMGIKLPNSKQKNSFHIVVTFKIS